MQRRLTSRLILTRWRGLTDDFGAPSLKSALHMRASTRTRQRKSKRAVTPDVLTTLPHACDMDDAVIGAAGNALGQAITNALLEVFDGHSGRMTKRVLLVRLGGHPRRKP